MAQIPLSDASCHLLMRNLIIESVDYVLMMIFGSTKDILNLKDSFRNKLALLYVNHFSRT